VVQTHYAGATTSATRNRLEWAIRAVDRSVLFDLQLSLSAYVDELRAVGADSWDRDRIAGTRRRHADELFAAAQLGKVASAELVAA
jgi:hypothetical protein